MHVANIVLVRAEDYEEALEIVREAVDEEDDIAGSIAQDWSDWSSVGISSRWKFADFVEGDYSGVHPYVVNLEEERPLFMEVFETFLSFRKVSYDDDFYSAESSIYDLHHDTASLSDFAESIDDKGELDWYAVLVDFHLY